MRPGAIVIGSILILLGVVLFLGNLDVLNVNAGEIISKLWPSILIIIALVQFYNSRGGPITAPVILLTVGVVLQLAALDIIPWGSIWPVVIIGFGIAILMNNRKGVSIPSTSVADSADTVNASAVFSGMERRITSKSFHGGKISATFGGVELDLRDAQLADDAILDVNVLCGGIELKVPENWNVDTVGSPFFGGISDKDRRSGPDSTPGPTLRIRASILFGGLDIKR